MSEPMHRIRRGEMLAVRRSHSSTSTRSGTERWTTYALGRATSVTRDGLVQAYEPAPGAHPVRVDPPGSSIHGVSDRYQAAAADLFGAATEHGPRAWSTPDDLLAELIHAEGNEP